MTKIYVVSKKGKLIETIDRKLRKGVAKVGAKYMKTYPIVVILLSHPNPLHSSTGRESSSPLVMQ